MFRADTLMFSHEQSNTLSDMIDTSICLPGCALCAFGALQTQYESKGAVDVASIIRQIPIWKTG
jgi:hypothetical protein